MPADRQIANLPGALAAVAGVLACPNCGATLAGAGRALVCADGHSFDVARQGYVSLLPPRRKVAGGDTAEMVAARAAFLAAGHYAPLAAAVTAAARAANQAAATVVDLGAGTGYYLAGVLDALPGARGLALDASRPALRRALQAHPRITAVACDVWHGLPLRSESVDLVLDVFAPRNAAEIARVLGPGGVAVVVTPAPIHLRELIDRVGTPRVDPDKEARLQAQLSPHLERVSSESVAFGLALGHPDAQALVAMGPAARHLAPDEIRRAVALLPDPARATAAVTIERYRRRPT